MRPIPSQSMVSQLLRKVSLEIQWWVPWEILFFSRQMTRTSTCISNMKSAWPSGLRRLFFLFFELRGFESEEGQWYFFSPFFSLFSSPKESFKAFGDLFFYIMTIMTKKKWIWVTLWILLNSYHFMSFL